LKVVAKTRSSWQIASAPGANEEAYLRYDDEVSEDESREVPEMCVCSRVSNRSAL